MTQVQIKSIPPICTFNHASHLQHGDASLWFYLWPPFLPCGLPEKAGT